MRVPDMLRFLMDVMAGRTPPGRHPPGRPLAAPTTQGGGRKAFHAWLPEERPPARHCPFFVR